MIKRRNLWLQVLWIILTLGGYAVYWFHVTAKEMVHALKRDDDVLLWTILFCFPPACLYSYYKYGELYEEFSEGSVDRWGMFILWGFFPPAVWFIVQRKLNERAAIS
ncbi:MAG: hypothetical protein ACXWP5_12660 [Bdellovibrionota bacterium]